MSVAWEDGRNLNKPKLSLLNLGSTFEPVVPIKGVKSLKELKALKSLIVDLSEGGHLTEGEALTAEATRRMKVLVNCKNLD